MAPTTKSPHLSPIVNSRTFLAEFDLVLLHLLSLLFFHFGSKKDLDWQATLWPGAGREGSIQLAVLSAVSKEPSRTLLLEIMKLMFLRHGLECVDSCSAKESNFFQSQVYMFLLRMRATSGVGPTLKMLWLTTGRSVGQAKEVRATQ